MPKITKQRATGPKKSTPRKQTDFIEPGIKLLVYGRGKTGKTRLACSFPKPVLIVATEDGTRSIATGRTPHQTLNNGNQIWSMTNRGEPNGIYFIRLTETTEIDELATTAVEGEFATVCVDTAGGLQDLILKEVLGLEDVPVQKSWGLAKQQDWGIVGAQFKERMRQLIDLADKVGINVVTIAHERNFSADGEATNVFDIAPTVGAALTPTAAGWLNGANDYICQTFLQERTEMRETKVAGKTVKTRAKTGKIDYCLRVGPHPVYQTGFRLPDGIELPDSIVNPSYESIVAIINGE